MDKYFVQQENRYVKIISNMNPVVAQMVKDLKNENYSTQSKDKIPILH
ncbi:hypothetical protein II582_01665 [bacterium]|jgi:hypothetical protein|nr:hypothetical protein [bacterium]